MMPQVERIEVLQSPLDDEALWGAAIDIPTTGSNSSTYAIPIEGWALGKLAPIETIEVVDRNVVIYRLPINQSRPDVAAEFPQVPDAETCGFRGAFSVLALLPRFKLDIVAKLQGTDRRIVIGMVRAERRCVRSRSNPQMQPVMLTSLGRSGSSWTMHLLARHPELVVYEPFRCEPRVASYWLQVTRALTKPASYLQTLGAVFADDDWWLGRLDNPPVRSIPHEELEIWMGREAIEEIASFSQRMIDEFYIRAAELSEKKGAVYFAEKFVPSEGVDLAWELYPRPREIILVRDFRDVFCSILAFNRKRGFLGFGREYANSDEEFVRIMRLNGTRLLRAWRRRCDRAHLVRYEDLVLNGRAVVTDLLAYIGIDSSPATVDAMTGGMTDRTTHQESHGTSADVRASIGRWRRDLTPSLQAACQNELGDLLSEFGYDIE